MDPVQKASHSEDNYSVVTRIRDKAQTKKTIIIIYGLKTFIVHAHLYHLKNQEQIPGILSFKIFRQPLPEVRHR
jgi:hypothetical protein